MNIFIRSMRIIGDLDDQFYDDERQRDVWNEASAVGFQVALWLTMIAVAVLPWVTPGTTGAWVSLGLLIGWLVVTATTIAYAKSFDVDIYTTSKLLRPRGIISAVLYFVAAIGVVVHLQEGTYLGEDSGTSWVGFAVGGVVGAAAVALIIGFKRRKQAAFDRAEDAEDANFGGAQ